MNHHSFYSSSHEISSQDHLHHSSSPSTFCGIKVMPGKPVTVSLPCNSFKSLHISQATLEYKKPEDIKMRSLVFVNYDGQDDILICSLRVSQCDMAVLKLDFHGPQDIVFSLTGPRGVHLAGYFYNYIPSPTNLVAPPIMDIGGRGIHQKESMLSIKIPGLGTADFVGDAVKEKGGTSFSIKILLPGLADSLYQIPVSLEHLLEAQSAAIVKHAIEKVLVNQHILQEEKQSGKNESTKKGENKCLPIVPEIDHGDNHEGSEKRKWKNSNKQLPITDEIECENNESSVRRKLDYVLPEKEVQPADRIEKESGKKRKKKREKKQLPEVDGAEGDIVEGEKKRKCKQGNKHLLTVEDIDANDNGSEEGRKQKLESTLPIIAADNDDGDPNEGSSVRRKLDYVLPVKEVQPLDSNDKEREKKQKEKREKKHLSKVDGAEGYNVEG
ncbi:uncharacterized protein LOC110685564 isoform X2 [Chenopodium quinoa]|uniref:uncharacterized protein LOC110685564 isoform X2 n=1 Tax=Chenopodium quinoa TaxID=63459 RepID=UPI000B77C049|nr:uncharacterized protein LOC110685564 isoform X2 [Chenopodium quinoa]